MSNERSSEEGALDFRSPSVAPGVREYIVPAGHSLRYIGRSTHGNPKYQCECGESPVVKPSNVNTLRRGKPAFAPNYVKRWHATHVALRCTTGDLS